MSLHSQKRTRQNRGLRLSKTIGERVEARSQSADKVCKRKNYPEKKENRGQFLLPASAALAACVHLRSGKFPCLQVCFLGLQAFSLLCQSADFVNIAGGTKPSRIFIAPGGRLKTLQVFKPAKAAGFDDLQNRQNRLVHGRDGAIFASEASFSRAKITSLQFPRPEIHRILRFRQRQNCHGSNFQFEPWRPAGEILPVPIP